MRLVHRVICLGALMLALLLSACSGEETNSQARTENLPAFSIDLPDGWVTNLPEGMECTAGRCLAGFAPQTQGSRSAVTVSVVPNLGKSLDEIVRESTANMAQFDAAMRPVFQNEKRVEYVGTIKGNDARLIATIDMDKQQVGVLLLVGENDQVRRIVASIRMTNPVLNFAPGADAAAGDGSATGKDAEKGTGAQ